MPSVPPAVPSIGDSDRYVAYTVVSSTSVFAVPFPVFGDGGDIAVFYNGVEQINNWVFSSASGSPLAAIAEPVTDGLVTLNTAITSGTLEIEGQWRPRQGILDTSPSLNRREYQQDLGQVVASLREMWTSIWNNFPLSKIGRANAFLGFDSQGNPAAIPFVGSSAPVSSAMAPVVNASTTAAALGIMGFSSYFLTLIGASNLSGLVSSFGFTAIGTALTTAANAAAARASLGSTTVGDAIFVAANAAGAMTAQGFSAFFQTLVGSANAAAALTTLGVSTFFQTLLSSTTGGQVANLLGYGAKRQTVLAGPVDGTTGLPNFLPATAVTLSITSQGVSSSAPLVVSAAAGGASGGANDLVGISTANLTWGSLTANVTNYLYVTVAANGTLTPASTTVTPVYQQGGTPAITTGLITFNIGQMTAYLGNGSAAAQAYVVLVGEAITGASTVTSTVMYAYNGRYVSPLGTAIPGTSAKATLTHNLGVPPLGYSVDLHLVNVTGDQSYTAGMELAANGGLGIGNLAAEDSHKASFSTLGAVTIGVAPYGGGASGNLTNADWNLRLYATRNF
jgi:hypothetical protein